MSLRESPPRGLVAGFVTFMACAGVARDEAQTLEFLMVFASKYCIKINIKDSWVHSPMSLITKSLNGRQYALMNCFGLDSPLVSSLQVSYSSQHIGCFYITPLLVG